MNTNTIGFWALAALAASVLAAPAAYSQAELQLTAHGAFFRKAERIGGGTSNQYGWLSRLRDDDSAGHDHLLVNLLRLVIAP